MTVAIGCTTSGSPAKSVAEKPGGRVMCFGASLGGSGAVDGAAGVGVVSAKAAILANITTAEMNARIRFRRQKRISRLRREPHSNAIYLRGCAASHCNGVRCAIKLSRNRLCGSHYKEH